MHPMSGPQKREFFMARSTAGLPRRAPRRLILGTALLLALAISLPPKVPVASAQDAKTSAGSLGVPAERSTPSSSPAAPPPEAAVPAAPSAPAAPSPSSKRSVDIGNHGISINIEKKDRAGDSSDDDEEIIEKDDAKGTITIRKNGKTMRMSGFPPD